METWVGLVPDIFNSMARHLNFTFTLALSRLKMISNHIYDYDESSLMIIFIRDGAWGSKNSSTGKWSGIIGQVSTAS